MNRAPVSVLPGKAGFSFKLDYSKKRSLSWRKPKRERKSDSILIYGTGMIYAAQGKRAEALATIKTLEAMSGASLDQAHWIAKIYAVLNEKELALSWLERGLAAEAIGNFYKDEPFGTQFPASSGLGTWGAWGFQDNLKLRFVITSLIYPT